MVVSLNFIALLWQCVTGTFVQILNAEFCLVCAFYLFFWVKFKRGFNWATSRLILSFTFSIQFLILNEGFYRKLIHCFIREELVN